MAQQIDSQDDGSENEPFGSIKYQSGGGIGRRTVGQCAPYR
jgi:hypothetical protein